MEPESLDGWQAVASELPQWGAAFSDRYSRSVVIFVMLLEAVDKLGYLQTDLHFPQLERECISLGNC